MKISKVAMKSEESKVYERATSEYLQRATSDEHNNEREQLTTFYFFGLFQTPKRLFLGGGSRKTKVFHPFMFNVHFVDVLISLPVLLLRKWCYMCGFMYHTACVSKSWVRSMSLNFKIDGEE